MYLVGSLVLGVTLVSCGRVYFAQRDSWRHEAEVECLKSGSLKQSPMHVRIDPINGPGTCGADFPLKVTALGDNPVIGFAEELRPPAAIPGASVSSPAPRWPIAGPRYAQPPYPAPAGSAPGAPISLAPPGVEAYPAAPQTYSSPSSPPYLSPARGVYAPDTQRYPSQRPVSARSLPDDIPDDAILPGRSHNAAPRSVPTRASAPNVPLRSREPAVTGAIGSAAVTPQATLACPIVSALDQWVGIAVQPAAMRWFGQPVAEIKQISAYSCRGMNGNPRARISEHAFGNALDIAAFVLADGRKVTVKDGWKGLPEEQGFLRDVQLAACDQFNTVLAPGSNRFHYDHIHVDLMRRSSGRRICQPEAIPGEVVAARAGGRNFARRGDPAFTGSIGTAKKKKTPLEKAWQPEEPDDHDIEGVDGEEPRGGPGAD